MSRLQSEWRRLYDPLPLTASASSAGEADRPDLIDAHGRVRALVLTLARPADWPALSAVWHAVQAELGLPAPAIAVSGVDACQLWFSLAQPVPLAEAHGFLDAVRRRHLGPVAPERIGLLPQPEVDATTLAWQRLVRPGDQAMPGQWAAFVASDLVPMFADTPWLDLPPSPEGQAELLSTLHSITPTAWQTALQRLQEAQPAVAGAAPEIETAPAPTVSTDGAAGLNPRGFLLQVMRDESAPLALRVEAAKALLPR